MGRFRQLRVNHQIFILMICIITLPLTIMSGIVYLFSLQTVKNEYQNSANLILNNLSFNIDQYLQSIETGTLTAQLDSQLQSSLVHWSENKNTDPSDISIKYGGVIEQFISRIELTVKNVDSVQVFAGGRIFYSADFNQSDYNTDDVFNQDWYKKTLHSQGKAVLFGAHTPFLRTNSSESVISIARVINKTGTRTNLAVILVDIRLDSLREILSLSENTNRNFLILDDEGGIVYSSDPNQEQLLKDLGQPGSQAKLQAYAGNYYSAMNGVPSYLNFITSPFSGWKVIQYMDEHNMTKDAAMFRKILLWGALCSLVTALLFMIMLSKRVTKPIIQLSKQVRAVGLGKFDVDLSTERQDEFGVLYKGIRKMVEDLQEHIERSSMTLAQQKVAQYGALKSQINPHFLANALESIQMKAIIAGQRDIADMVGLLGRLFRIHIQTGKDIVSLREELEHTRLYVKVQQMRFGDKISYSEKIEPGAEMLPVLHFSLQPIVENAIVHGLERKSGQGSLEIAAFVSGQALHIEVADNGAGMTEEDFAKLRQRLNEAAEDTLGSTHIGVKNVQDRIRYYYGDGYGLAFESRPGEGTKVTLRFPAAKAISDTPR
ncbi:histidine kinase [Paenibacillus sp. ATY16]|uniref:cache domain-containing sensor histidine kinase n=1 Tax=Paenibacillus sp. ATY16 TaxID=1759312 RepID=UPI000E2EA9C0|nr:histidine kinase [Paenibacillus sp. ATY16]MCK9857645.1 sensor histidine kinase [Paenibacillus sp. ATY16]